MHRNSLFVPVLYNVYDPDERVQMNPRLCIQERDIDPWIARDLLQ